jgi:hypothetical protein
VTDSRSTAVVKVALVDGDAPKSRATAVVKVALVDGDAPKSRATAVVKVVWANVERDCCCAFAGVMIG